MELKFRTLYAEEIDCRVAQCKKTKYKEGVQLLLYKDARVDMDILDETVGVHRWQRKHYEAKGNMYCSVGISFENNLVQNGVDWVWKDDCGAESFTEKEKGEASDSFKRACVNWGIGRELYTAPQIFAEWQIEEDKGKLKPKYNPTFYVKDIDYDEKRNISFLVIHARSGSTDKEVFRWSKAVTQKQKQVQLDMANASEFDDNDLPPFLSFITEQEVLDLGGSIRTVEWVRQRYNVKSFFDLTKEQAAEIRTMLKEKLGK